MSEDWLKISLEFSMCSLQEPETAEENIMRLLLDQIGTLLKVTHRNPRRIWTLHKIIGNQVRFYRSNERQRSEEHQDIVRPITEGLIGRAIQEKDNVTIFKNARDVKGFILGWENCQSELIGLVKDGTGKPIGVVNVESDISDDFFCDDNPEIESQRRELKQQLEQLVRIACSHLSSIFKNQILIQERRSSSSLIEELSIAPISSPARLQEVIELTFAWLKDRSELSRAVFYITDLEDKSRYIKAAKYGKVQTSTEVLPDVQEIRSLFEPGSHNITKSKVANIFGKEFAEKFIDNADETNIYFDASEIFDDHKSLSIRYFIGIIISQRDSGYILDQVRSCFKVSRNATTRYLRNKANEYTELLNKITIDMYRTTLQEGNFRTTLNQIAASIANKTGARFCLIYLVAPEEYYHSRHKFYLGGAGKGEVNFADIRFNQETGIVARVLNNKQSYYNSSFYDCDINGHLLDHYLKEKGLERPEVHAFPLFQKQSDAKIGAILLLRENLDSITKNDNPNIDQVKIMLSEWSDHLSGIIYTERQKQANSILSETYERLIEIVPHTVERPSDHQLICNLQEQITRRVLPLWSEILSPASFVIYKLDGQEFKLFDVSVLPKNIDAKPPTFKVGQGLTGSVINMESKEIYEPFVEDFEDYRNMSELNHSAPDAVCKGFWDRILGDKRRMYYGRHIKISEEDYILLVVGVRQSKFLPPLGYKLAHDLIDTTCKYVKAIATTT
jgi:hypothetical protein